MIPILMQKPNDETGGRYGFGTSAAVDAFIKTISSYNASKEILLAVNLSTLLRNSLSAFTFVDGKKVENQATKGLDVNGVVAKVRTYMVEIANEFATICQAKFKDRNHHILFYFVDYTKQVPREWQKESKSADAWRLTAASQAFLKMVRSEDQTSGNVSMHVRLAAQMKSPSYVGLAEVLKTFARYDVDLHLISHMPLDYHVTGYSGRKGFLYRSHTGEVVKLTPSDLSKVVFKEESVPFYPATHVLFGDKYLVKGCLSTKEKNRFIELAKTNRWNLRTSDYIKGKISEYNFPLSFKL